MRCVAGVSKLARPSRSPSGPRAATSSCRRASAPRPSPKTASPSPRKSICEDVYENMGARMVREVASKTSDMAGDGTTTATVLAEAIFNEGLKAVVAGVNPIADEARHRQGRRRHHRRTQEDVDQLKSKKEIAQVGTVAGQQRRRDRRPPGRSDGKGRQGRRDHGRRRQEPQDRSRGRRRHAVRPRLSLPLLRHRSDRDGMRARRLLRPGLREEDLATSRNWCRCWKRSSTRASRC